MAVTRDADYPQEMAALMEAFNRCADGHSAHVVMNAAMQLTIAAINYLAREAGKDRTQTMGFCKQVTDCIAVGVADNIDRASKPSDDVRVAAQ